MSAPRVSSPTVMSWCRPEGQGLGPVAMPATPSHHDDDDDDDGGGGVAMDDGSLRVKFSQGRTGYDTCHSPTDRIDM